MEGGIPLAPGRLGRLGLVLLGSAGAVGLIGLVTGRTPPLWDAITYVSMARDGWLGNPHLIAPFAYRPGMPWLAGAVARAFSLPVETGFTIVAYLAATVLLAASVGLARAAGAPWRGAAFAGAAIGLSFAHVKFPLFFPTLVDVAAYPVVVGAMWAVLRRRDRLAFALGWAGLFFKEFAILPLAVLGGMRLFGLRRSPSRRGAIVWLGGAVLVGAAVIVPRLVVPVTGSFQEIDPRHLPGSWRALYRNPLNLRLDANIAYAFLGYWLPTLLLATPRRLRALPSTLAGGWKPWGAYLAGVLVLTLYGGTNLFAFAAYAAPVQVVVLAALFRGGVGGGEAAFALVATFLFNRIAFPIPLPAHGFDAYIDFYGGWADRFGWRALGRTGEILGYVALAQGVRWVRPRGRAGGAGPPRGDDRRPVP